MDGLKLNNFVESFFPGGAVRIPHKTKILESLFSSVGQGRVLSAVFCLVLTSLVLDPVSQRWVLGPVKRDKAVAMLGTEFRKILESLVPLLRVALGGRSLA